MRELLRVSSLCADRKQAALLVTLACLVSFTVAAGLACNSDSECRRNVCINSACTSRPLIGGTCKTSSQCLDLGAVCNSNKVCELPFIPADPQERWTGVQALPVYVDLNAVVAVDEKLYSIGGQVYTQGATGSTFVYDANTNVWKQIDDPPAKLKFHTAVVVGKSIFVAGGENDFYQSTTSFFRLDTTTNKWDAADAWTQLPVALVSPVIVSVGNFVYLFGGRDSSTTRAKTIYRFDTSKPQSAWTNPANFPSGFSSGSAAANGNLVYITGGYDESNTESTSTYVYDVNTPTVAPKPFKPLLAPRQGHMSFIINYKLYILGGSIGADSPRRTIQVIDLAATNPVWTTLSTKTYYGYIGPVGGLIRNRFFISSVGISEVYDFQNSVTPHPPLAPPPLAHGFPFAFFVSFGGSLVLSGSFDQNGVALPDVQVYDLNTKTWSTGPPLFKAVNGAEAYATNDALYVAGGSTGEGAVATIQKLTSLQGQWSKLTDMPTVVAGSGLAATASNLILFGGSDGSDILRIIQIYSFQTGWLDSGNSPALTTGVSEAAVAVIEDLVYIVGGRDANGGISDLIQIFDLNTMMMSATQYHLGFARFGHSVTESGGRLYIIGGFDSEGQIVPNEIFNPATEMNEPLEPTPNPRGNHGSALGEYGTIYVAGGCRVPGLCSNDFNTPLEKYFIPE